jgi:hypothetical protein
MLSESRRGPIPSFFAEATRRWSEPRLRLPIAALVFAAVTVVTYLIADLRMFTGFMAYDDEGYMLTALKGYVEHGHLYDEVFTQYGPFYYEAWGGLFALLGLPIDHDTGRAVTMAAWIVSALTVGLATMRFSGSLLLGLGTQMLVFTAFGVLTNEPMHPGGIICLLLAALLAIACCVRDRPSPMSLALLGAAVAALMLVKINVGVFALVAVLLACAVSYPAVLERRWARPLVEAAFVALPVVLLASKFDEGWPRRLAVHIAVAALAVVIVLRARRSDRRADEELGWLLGGALVLGLVSCATILATGTSLDGLIQGLLRQPLRQSDAFTIPMQLDSRIYGLDLIALGAAAAYWYVSRERRGDPGPGWSALTSLFSVGVGLAMALSVTGKGFPFDAGEFPGYQFALLGFCWVALLRPDADRRRDVSFALLLLPPLAVAQALHVFPVAGSQTLFATFLLVPVGAVCIANGARGLHAALPAGAERRALAAVAACVAVVIGYMVVNSNLREPLKAAEYGHEIGVPLQLPGAESIHLLEEEADLYERISASIDRNCASLIMLPGMNSFYFWTEMEPPTGYTATGWPTLFDDEHQRQVIADIDPIENLCLLRNEPYAAGWSNGEIPDGPLVRYLESGFEPIGRWGDYELLRRQEAGTAS